MTLRLISHSTDHVMRVVHVLVDTKDAMGANLITQTCEYLKSALEESCGEKPLMGIVSNLNTLKAQSVSKGHMRLHLKNLLRQEGAGPEEEEKALQALSKTLSSQNYVSAQDARHILIELRS